MEESNNKVWNIVLTIIVLLALAFGIYYLVTHRSEPNNMVNQSIPGSDYYVSVIQAKHQYKNGEHTYVGSLDLPSACYKLDSGIEKTGSTTAAISLETSTNPEEVCAQMVTSRTFRLQVDGGTEMTVKGMLNGKPVELNLFEVPANQDIDLFEINIKG